MMGLIGSSLELKLDCYFLDSMNSSSVSIISSFHSNLADIVFLIF